MECTPNPHCCQIHTLSCTCIPTRRHQPLQRFLRSCRCGTCSSSMCPARWRCFGGPLPLLLVFCWSQDASGLRSQEVLCFRWLCGAAEPEAVAPVLGVFFRSIDPAEHCQRELAACIFPVYLWHQTNGPGGRDKKGILSGEVMDVPFLKATGFTKASSCQKPVWSHLPRNLHLHDHRPDIPLLHRQRMFSERKFCVTDTSPTSTQG